MIETRLSQVVRENGLDFDSIEFMEAIQAKINDVGVYRRALFPEEVWQLYQKDL